MQTMDIIKAIRRLPVNQKLYVVEETIKSIKKDEVNHQIEHAANVLYNDYEKVTAFTTLDLETFYEAK